MEDDTRKRFLQHPLVQVLDAEAKLTRIDWVDKKTFSMVLLRVLQEKGAISVYEKLDQFCTSLTGNKQTQFQTCIDQTKLGLLSIDQLETQIVAANLFSEPQLVDFRTALTGIRDEIQSRGLDASERSRILLTLKGLQEINEPLFSKAINTVIASVEKVEDVEKALEGWFDRQMVRMTDEYKRNITLLSFFIGLVLALILNADALQISRSLFDDPSLRAALMVAAQNAVERGTAQEPQLTPETTPPPDEAGQDTNSASAQVVDPDDPVANIALTAAELQRLVEQFMNLNLPISWENTALEASVDCSKTGDEFPTECDNMRNFWLFWDGRDRNPNFATMLARKIIGLLITTLAIAQGAPFWFELLNRLVRGRASGNTTNNSATTTTTS